MPGRNNGSLKWLVPIRRPANPALRLICFPFGGGGAASYWNWQSELAKDIELWAVRLPGREQRIAEAFATDAASVVRALFEEIRGLDDLKYVLYGHSLGAGLAFQTANLLSAHHERLPELFVASGRMPPHHPYPGQWADRTDQELIQRLLELGGAPPGLLVDKMFLSIYLPRVRADFRLNESLAYRRFAACDFPITIINGDRDPLVDAEWLGEWRGYTNREFAEFTVKGGHFFIQTNYREFMGIVSAGLERVKRRGLR